MHPSRARAGDDLKTITITNTHVCSHTDPIDREYVLYSGEIAGVSDRLDLQRDSETLNRRSDEVKLERQGVNGV
jgi:hypothetical protein